MFNGKQIGPAMYEIPRTGKMRVPGLLIATDPLLQELAMERPLEQLCNVAHLPGIIGHSVAMPDMHWGYGFPIGGVAAMDAKEGVISPGGVGYDINCGVRLALIPIPFTDLSTRVKEKLIHSIYQLVPSGVGKGKRSAKKLSEKEYADLLTRGASWSVEQGFGYSADILHSESNGCIAGADSSVVSSVAKERGRDQLGTIGSGNHFVEIGQIEDIFDLDIASAWQVEKGQTYLLIHSGSRGFGHQVCQDTLNLFLQKGYHRDLPDKQLVAAPIASVDGKNYIAAMAAAANFAFNNRQQVLHQVRLSFEEVCGIGKEEVRLLYDVCHNIAKCESQEIEGKERQVYVHRKGATRSFGPGEEELPPLFYKTGQPVLVPGDMGRASYLLVGSGHKMTFRSCCHGAGRQRSRVQSLKAWKSIDLLEHMAKKEVMVKASSHRTIAEEMPDAYKDVNVVVDAVEKAKLARRVARLRPHLVLKG